MKGLFVHLVQTSSGAGLHEDAVDDGVFHHGEVGGDLLILLGQGEEGGREQKEGYQGQSHLWQRGNEQKIMRPCVCVSQNSYLTKCSLFDIWFGGGRQIKNLFMSSQHRWFIELNIVNI